MKVFYNDIALTKDIQDEERSNMAYNVLYGMAEAGVEMNVDGTPQRMDKAQLSVVDENGIRRMPELDKEWFGTEEENEAARDVVLDQIIEEMKADGAEPSREFEASLMDQYTVSYRERGQATTYFTPQSWDIDKARDVYSILTTDLDPAVSYEKETKYDGRVKLMNKESCLSVSNLEGDCYKPEKEDITLTDEDLNFGEEAGLER